MLVLRSKRVITPGGTRAAAVHVRDERIEKVTDWEDAPPEVMDYGELVLMPGVVDSHVHVNEPGRTEWEGFDTATRAAAAGGVTTIVDMPLNSVPPTTTVEALHKKVEAFRGKAWVDVGLWGGAVPENTDDLLPLLDEGALGFKCFLIDSGVPEFPRLTIQELTSAAEILRDSGAPILVHAELPEKITTPASGDYSAYLASRPRAAEEAAIDAISKIARRTRCWLHIVHLSAGSALPFLARVRQDGLPLTVETTPHYLFFNAEEIAAGATEYKCAPPIRERANRDQLWKGLAEGVIDAVVTDHSPAPPELKSGDFGHAWGGIASLQFGLAAAWTEASRRGFDLNDMVRWMSRGPARIAGLTARKGAIAAGRDADLVVFDPDATFRVQPSEIEHRHKITPYRGLELKGVVNTTFVRGKKVFQNGTFLGSPAGVWLRNS